MFPLKKVLDIHEGGSLFPVHLNNGDVYDSCADLIVNGVVDWDSNVVNTRATVGYHGGKLSKGLYYGIVGHRQDIDWRVIKLFDHNTNISNIKSEDDIPSTAWSLPSDFANPNHGGAHYVEFVQIHPGGGTYQGAGNNWSHACITILNESSDFTHLMQLLVDGEIIEVNLH